ncbi:hypothetical protein VitviT2T_017953 [Vitis vinifera]|uniref:MADS-box domain-containing protein n=2 Tax=Vitis vinifera TaxID=29760 RepID=A0ABY9CZ51_VITVI|nr:hypothetical protein VitviT2T_017953 [Vitis vinifera]|eukprot:XP_010657334.1 PREDICTED: agamous-like MADS-box protein AGL66 isoform X1 [Vitis vinifera]
MGRKKLVMQKLGNPSSRQVTFTKRKDGIVKKATELSILCGADVGLIMFSPKGRSITFASGGRVEDIFIRWIAQAAELTGQGPICDGGYLTESLKHLKCEQEMLEKIERMEALEESLYEIKEQILAAEEKMRIYNPDVEKINTVHEAQEHQQFLVDAIQRIEQLKVKLLSDQITLEKPESSQVRLLDDQILPQKPENLQVTRTKNADPTTEGLNDANTSRNLPGGEHHEETAFPAGPHLTMSYLKAQNLAGEGTSCWFDDN